MAYEVGQVVRTVTGDTVCLTAYNPKKPKNKWSGHLLNPGSRGKTYIWSEDQFIPGSVRPAKEHEMAMAASKDDRYDHEQGKDHARFMARFGPEEERPYWAKLATVEVGDEVVLYNGKKATFKRIMTQGRKYAFVADEGERGVRKYSALAIRL